MSTTTSKIEVKKYRPIVYGVYEHLRTYHQGEENAISAKDLSRRFNISERTLRDIINEIRNSGVFQLVIGSSDRGYYVCREDEFNAMNNRLKSAAFSLLKVAYANDKKAAKDGQMRIKMGRYVKECFEAFSRAEKQSAEEKDGRETSVKETV